MDHAAFLQALRGTAAGRARALVIANYEKQRHRYQRAYAIITDSMRAARQKYDTCAWIPPCLYDRSFISRETLAESAKSRPQCHLSC